jgi:flagellar protein FlaG
LAADTFVTALLLITAVISAGILINAVYPVVWNMAGTFSTASHETDTRMRTDFKIVGTYAASDPATGGLAKIWMKNTGTTTIGKSEIEKSDVFIGLTTDFDRAHFMLAEYLVPSTNLDWSYTLYDESGNQKWDPGETLEIRAFRDKNQFDIPGRDVYFQFVLPNGVWRSTEFKTSS